MARRFVLSTVGTSLFTNVLAPAERQEWVGKLNSQSNETAFPPVVAAKVDELSQRVRTRLREGDVLERRRLSAELNGLYGLYGEKLSADGDVHYLIATDTALGKTAADVVRDFLRQQGLNITVHVPERLNTASTTHFSHGMKALLKWCEDTIPGFRTSGYEVIFNLTGGFKSLQGYLNIIGMFYADRLVYIFEGSPTEGAPELLSIPKLPIRLDTEALHTHAPTLALLSAGAAFRREEIATIPEALLRVNVNGEATFSEWGDLVWNRMRQDILAGPLLTFPYLQYEASFLKDFEKATRSQRIAVQETLAEVSAFLLLEEGDLQVLRAHGGLQYDNYTSQRTDNKPPIGHFRMAGGDRVSCTAESGSLRLRHFGVHDYVNERP